MRPVRRALLGLSLLAAGCGGGDAGVVTNGAAPAPTAAVTVTTQEDTAQAAPRPTGKPEFRVELTGESSQATVGRPWRYTVRATALTGGRPASGTAKMRIFVDDELVDTLGFFFFEGTLRRTHRWQSVLRGKTGVVLQAEVEGAGGTVRVNYPVTVN
jgi:hypothetical protein